MGILPLKKRVNRDKCNFATKQRMFGVFAIDEILRYRGTRFPHFMPPWLRLVEWQSPCENSDLIAFPGFQYQCRRHLSAEKENPVQKHQISDTMSHHSLDKYILLRAFLDLGSIPAKQSINLYFLIKICFCLSYSFLLLQSN